MSKRKIIRGLLVLFLSLAGCGQADKNQNFSTPRNSTAGNRRNITEQYVKEIAVPGLSMQETERLLGRPTTKKQIENGFVRWEYFLPSTGPESTNGFRFSGLVINFKDERLVRWAPITKQVIKH
jgi:hypothetical protein